MASAPLPADPTLDEIREAVAPRLASHAAFDGWTDKAVESAAMEIGVDADLAKLSLKGGPMALIEAWIGSVDVEMALPAAEKLDAMKILQRITALVATRLESLRRS
jgi:ubiquinone biosynthesis protein COQ9